MRHSDALIFLPTNNLLHPHTKQHKSNRCNNHHCQPQHNQDVPNDLFQNLYFLCFHNREIDFFERKGKSIF